MTTVERAYSLNPAVRQKEIPINGRFDGFSPPHNP